ATGRAASRCRSGNALLSLVRGRRPDWRDPGFAQDDRHPVVCVSWDDANAYARWLGARTGIAWRLPNAAEWNAVARAAGAGTRCGHSNIAARDGCDDRYEYTAPVGRHGATAPGVHDIAGNVGEWIDICARPGRAHPACGEHRYRGLSWRDDAEHSNLERDEGAAATIGYVDVGFRLVHDLPAPAR
ncbi:MAG TPA: SUMF1/EgtB/PvdO family nonheme iron enzyme, partial [Dokdonella sp.]